MQLAAIPRWQWIALAIVAGTIVGLTTDAADSQLYGINVQGYGMLLADQEQFENGLIQDFNGVRLFSNPVVYPHWTAAPDGQRKLVYIVSGTYWDGHQQMKDGKAVAEWVPRCIITQTPYRPRIGVTDESNAAAQEYPSVVEFLNALHRSYRVNYRYAWWALHPVLTWIVGCTLVIGGVWPTLINLLSYGSFARPSQVKPLSLWNIRRVKKDATLKFPSSPPAPEVGQEVLPPPPAPLETHDPVPPEVRPLAGAPLQLVPNDPKEQRAYGADQGDFYPTERHAPRLKSS